MRQPSQVGAFGASHAPALAAPTTTSAFRLPTYPQRGWAGRKAPLAGAAPAPADLTHRPQTFDLTAEALASQRSGGTATATYPITHTKGAE